jgi:hypothetical protein
MPSEILLAQPLATAEFIALDTETNGLARDACEMTEVGAVLVGGLLAGCGDSREDYANKPRPASPINVTAAISDKKISISPKQFGAGPVVIIVSNQTGDAQTVTLETDELGGSQPGIKTKTDPIAPRGTGTLKVDVREGSYALSTSDGPKAAAFEVGPERKSAQDQLLQP